MRIAPPLTAMGNLRWSVVRPILERLAPRRVLEVGCGQGSVGARIARTADYVGIEPDDRACRVARERINPYGGQVLHRLTELAPGDGQFDVVCAFEVLEHLEDDVGALTEWMTRLSPGGAVVVSVPAWPDRFSAMDVRVGHYRRYTPAALRALLEDAGCVDAQTSLYGWPLGYALEGVRGRLAAREERAATDDMAERSAASGRLYQPAAAIGAGLRVAVAPFAYLQRMRPHVGTGLVAVGRLTPA